MSEWDELKKVAEEAPREPWSTHAFAKWYNDKDKTQRTYSRFVGACTPDTILKLIEAAEKGGVEG